MIGRSDTAVSVANNCNKEQMEKFGDSNSSTTTSTASNALAT